MSEHVITRLRAVVATHGDRPATRIRREDAWVTQTYAQFGERVRAVAQGLIEAGVPAGGRVGIFLNNCPEWSEIDFGALTARAVPVPLYATSTPEQIAHIAADSGLSIMFVGGASEADRVQAAGLDVPIVTVHEDGALTYADFLASPTDAVEERFAGATGDELASVVYTSGTTGAPKGVMIQHDALVTQSDALDAFFTITPEDGSLSFLPLSHALERAWTVVVLLHGAQNTYVENPRTVAEQLVLAQPTLLVSVPKLYETVFATARAKAAGSRLKNRIFTWSLDVARRRPGSLGHKVADALVLKAVRNAVGGPKSVLACGGAPLRVEVEEFFAAIGLPICSGYGLTEASPLISFNAPGATKVGSVGRVLEGGEIRIGEGGEVLYRGPNVMAGYWNDPEASAAALRDGWLHTGDIGALDADGYLSITDRLKDIIVTLGGKNVAPQPIEGLILADPLFEHAVLLGDNRPYVTLLVKPAVAQVEALAKARAWRGELADWMASSELLDELRQRVEAISAKLPTQDRPKDTRVVGEEFTMDNGLLTPTLKVRRRAVEARFAALVEEMYARRRPAP